MGALVACGPSAGTTSAASPSPTTHSASAAGPSGPQATGKASPSPSASPSHKRCTTQPPPTVPPGATLRVDMISGCQTVVYPMQVQSGGAEVYASAATDSRVLQTLGTNATVDVECRVGSDGYFARLFNALGRYAYVLWSHLILGLSPPPPC